METLINLYKFQVEGDTMSIKAVFFDLGDTLIESSSSAFETFQKILKTQGVYVSVEEVENAFTAAREELGDKFEQLIGRIPSSEFYRMWDSCVLKALRITDNGDLARIIHEQWSTTIKIMMFPDVKPTLTILKGKGIKTGIISNAYEEEIREICEGVGLDELFFDIIVGSDTAQKAKPDPEIFTYALRKLKITPEEAIFVGNDLEKDYNGAKRAGMNPFLIVRGDAETPEPVTYIRSLRDLIDCGVLKQK